MKKLFVMASILTTMLVVGCTSSGSSPPPSGELAVINHEMTKGESGVAVRVTVKNVGSVMVELAQVTVSFYDADKNLIDSSSDSVMNLGAGETWDFEIACQGTGGNEIRSYEIKTLAGTSSGGL